MTMRPDEEWAKEVIEAVLGVTVDQNDFNTGTSVYDLRIGNEQALDAAIEVAAARDPGMESLHAAMDTRLDATSEGQCFVPGSGVQGTVACHRPS